EEVPTRLLAFCLMPNHWHLVLWPEQDGELSRYLHRVTMTPTQRWHAHHHTTGTGPLYQGRFKSFPVQADEHLLTVCRYVERNPLGAGLVRRAEHWRWSSLWHCTQGARFRGRALPGAPLSGQHLCQGCHRRKNRPRTVQPPVFPLGRRKNGGAFCPP